LAAELTIFLKIFSFESRRMAGIGSSRQGFALSHG